MITGVIVKGNNRMCDQARVQCNTVYIDYFLFSERHLCMIVKLSYLMRDLKSTVQYSCVM